MVNNKTFRWERVVSPVKEAVAKLLKIILEVLLEVQHIRHLGLMPPSIIKRDVKVSE